MKFLLVMITRVVYKLLKCKAVATKALRSKERMKQTRPHGNKQNEIGKYGAVFHGHAFLLLHAFVAIFSWPMAHAMTAVVLHSRQSALGSKRI